MAKTSCPPGSHPHDDRRNWRPAETFGEYLTNVSEGLEEWSERRAATLLGWSRVSIWRGKMMAKIPEDLFDLLMDHYRQQGRAPSSKELANVGRALSGEGPSADVERCPHCDGVVRVRGRWSQSIRQIVNRWISKQ